MHYPRPWMEPACYFRLLGGLEKRNRFIETICALGLWPVAYRGERPERLDTSWKADRCVLGVLLSGLFVGLNDLGIPWKGALDFSNDTCA
jgi:hypothetical protein